jgi:hypothetical protein
MAPHRCTSLLIIGGIQPFFKDDVLPCAAMSSQDTGLRIRRLGVRLLSGAPIFPRAKQYCQGHLAGDRDCLMLGRHSHTLKTGSGNPIFEREQEGGCAMKYSIRYVAVASLIFGLSACVPPPPPPPPPPPMPMPMAGPPPAYVAPAPPPQASYRCGPGFHWVRGHRNRWGRWVHAHCVPNRR